MMGTDDPRVTAYVVGEADAETAAAVEASEALKAEAAEIREMAQRLAEALASEATPALHPRQRAEIQRLAGRRRRAWALGSWAAGLAAAALLVVGVTLYRQTPREAGGPEVKPESLPPPVTQLPPAMLPPPPTVAAPTIAPATPAQARPAAAKPPASLAEAEKLNTLGYVGAKKQAQVPSLREEVTVPGHPVPAQTSSEVAAVEGGVPGGVVGGVVGGVAGGRLGGVPEDRFAAVRPASGPFNREAYAHRTDNGFLTVEANPLSTFSIDVDTASYSNVRRFLNEGRLPPPDAVRIEEMVNYFTYDDAPPTGRDPFAARIEVGPAPWNTAHRLARIALMTRELTARPDSNLVFLIDVSGSMMPPNKLPLVRQALRLLVTKLTERDRVAMVVYAGSAGQVLPPTRGDERERILDAIDRLEAGGTTNGGAGIQLAYDLASRDFIKGGVNRVILATDGDFNVGTTDEGSLVRLVEEKAKTGVFLSVFGFGMGNYQDSRLEALADKGNGNYGYIDSIHEARKAFVEQTNATLVTVAKDVKIQVEFNPTRVQAYRLIGYENRLLRPEDFKDDTKDAGEVGAGQAVTALYELVPAGGESTGRQVDPLAYQQKGGLTEAARSDELLRLKVRYKAPEAERSRPLEWPGKDAGTPLERTSPDFRFAAAVAELGMILRDSPHKGHSTLEGVLQLAEAGRGGDKDGYRAEFIALVHKAKGLRGAE